VVTTYDFVGITVCCFRGNIYLRRLFVAADVLIKIFVCCQRRFWRFLRKITPKLSTAVQVNNGGELPKLLPGKPHHFGIFEEN